MSDRVHTGFGPGKVILLGEHAVVYGHPALAAPLSWGVTARAAPAKKCALVVPSHVRGKSRSLLTGAFARAADAVGKPAVRVTLESDLPVSMGLGSSAAVAVATARALLSAAGEKATPKRVLEVALAMETEFHVTPSGVDHTTSAYGELLRYARTREGAKAKVVHCDKPVKILVALVGDRSPTRETVAGLRGRIERWPKRYRRVMDQIGQLADEGVAAVRAGDLEGLGDLMNMNQGLLSAIGLTSGRIDEMLHRLRQMGALGAKLTGAGGDGGAVIALFREPEPAVARLSALGVRCFASQIAGPRAL
jgi:mevalonate kinase